MAKKKKKKKPKPKKEHIKKEQKTLLSKLKNYYIKEYRKLFYIPLGLFIFSIIAIAAMYFTTGDFIRRDVTLKGGISLTINAKIDADSLQGFLAQRFPGSSINIRTLGSRNQIKGIIIEASDIDQDNLISAVREQVEFTDYSVETMGSSLGESFFQQMFIALLLAFFSMGLVFHFYFKNIYATSAALISALFDIVITAAIMDLIGVRLTAGGIAAYLMLIGYSIDTSILISTKLLREKSDNLYEGLFGAMSTGLTMSAAGIAATLISFLLTNNTTLRQIMLILIIGLFMDLITTWIGNVAFLRFYLDKKAGAHVKA